MPRLKLTEKSIAKLRAPTPSKRQVLHWDSELKGFAVLCSGVSNARTYIAQRDVNNRTRRITLGAVSEIGLEKARERAADTLDDLRRGKDPKRRGLKLRSALEDYLKVRRDLRPDSIRAYRQAVDHLKPWLDLPLGSITTDMVADRHAEIAEEVKKGGRYSGKTAANMAMRAFRALWNFQPDLGECPVKILRKQKRWNKEKPRERMVENKDMPEFFRAVSELANPVARDFILLLTFTGLRRGEASRLTWDNVDFKERVIKLPATSTKAKVKLDIPMTDVVHSLLVTRRAIGNAGYIFPGQGKSKHVVDVGHPLDQVAKTTGIRISAHDLRRGYITIAENTKNVSSAAVMVLVNHALPKSVHSDYIQKVENLREPAQLIADRIKEMCQIKKLPGVAEINRG
jgi:integrase